MGKGKSIVVADEPGGGGASDDSGKMRVWRSRKTMDFDPKLKPLRSQEDVLDI